MPILDTSDLNQNRFRINHLIQYYTSQILHKRKVLKTKVILYECFKTPGTLCTKRTNLKRQMKAYVLSDNTYSQAVKQCLLKEKHYTTHRCMIFVKQNRKSTLIGIPSMRVLYPYTI